LQSGAAGTARERDLTLQRNAGYPRSSTAFPSDSAQAFATAEFGSVLPGIGTHPAKALG